MTEKNNRSPERRDFLADAAFWTTTGALGFAAIGISRMPKPGVLPGQASTIKIGMPGEFPIDDEPMRVPNQNLFLLHDEQGFAVLSALCSHLGCVVNEESPTGFKCPCHGSRFTSDGSVIQGPAPSALSWYELSLAPDGQIIVDLQRTVPVGTKFQLS